MVVWDQIKDYLKQYILLDILASVITFISWHYFTENLGLFMSLISMYILIDIYIGYNNGKENDLYEVIALFIIIIIYQIITYYLIKWLFLEYSTIRLLFSWYSMVRLSFFPFAIASFIGWKNY